MLNKSPVTPSRLRSATDQDHVVLVGRTKVFAMVAVWSPQGSAWLSVSWVVVNGPRPLAKILNMLKTVTTGPRRGICRVVRRRQEACGRRVGGALFPHGGAKRRLAQNTPAEKLGG